jgi:uncharacterized protein YbaP (TraB family)
MPNTYLSFSAFFNFKIIVLKKESLLWKFKRPQESRTHFLLGTMHVNSEEAYTPVTLAKYYMDQCQLYAGEMDLDDPDLNSIGDVFVNPDDQHLQDLIGLKKYNKYKKVLAKAFSIDLDQIAHYRPLVISNMVSESILTKTFDLALDHFLWQYAQASGLKMKGLESASDQFDIMRAIPLDNQLKALQSCTKNVSKFRKKVLKLSELYKAGELTKLYKTSKKSMGSLRKLMIYDRNTHMTQNLVALSKDAATFCAVGAAHLPGNKGMLRQLKTAGFKVSPIL